MAPQLLGPCPSERDRASGQCPGLTFEAEAAMGKDSYGSVLVTRQAKACVWEIGRGLLSLRRAAAFLLWQAPGRDRGQSL